MTAPNLLNADDFGKFKSKDESWFLDAATDVLRDYCGWHIYPEVPVTNQSARIGNTGIVMLPTLNLVSVQRVTFDEIELPVAGYEAHASGWIQLVGYAHTGESGFVAQWANAAHYAPSGMRWVTVDYTHGFSTLPKAVAEVGYELVARTLEKPAGVAKSLRAGPYDFAFNEFGMVLTEDQQQRLNAYRVIEP